MTMPHPDWPHRRMAPWRRGAMVLGVVVLHGWAAVAARWSDVDAQARAAPQPPTDAGVERPLVWVVYPAARPLMPPPQVATAPLGGATSGAVFQPSGSLPLGHKATLARRESRPAAAGVAPGGKPPTAALPAPVPAGLEPLAPQATGPIISAAPAGLSISTSVEPDGPPGPRADPGRRRDEVPASPAAVTAEWVAALGLPGNPLPAYPEPAREDGLQGTVQLQVHVDPRGQVLAVRWLRRSGVMLLDLAARDTVRTWRFEPARQGGVAVASALTLSVRFQLEQPVVVAAVAQAQRP